MATIECNEELSCHVSLAPYVVIFASVLVLLVRPAGFKTFFFIEVFQFAVREFVYDTPSNFRLIG